MSQLDSRDQVHPVPAGERYAIVTCDSHVGPSVREDLRPFCDAKYLADFDRFADQMDGNTDASRTVLRSSEAPKPGGEESWSLMPKPGDMPEDFAAKAGIRHAEQVDLASIQRSYEHSLVPGLSDPRARHADMDSLGIAGDVIFHGGLNGQSVPFSTTGLVTWGDSSYNHLEKVGVRIYNRWLADFVSSAPERHAGIAHIPVSDLDACVTEVEWAAKAGLRGGINFPAPRSDIPMLNEPAWENLWSACEDTGMPLNTHGAGGEHYPYRGPGAVAMYMMETTWRTRRGLWILIFGGVFERHPRLKFVLTEQWADWVPSTLANMDSLYYGPGNSALRAGLPKPPSEYFRQNCYIGASFMSNEEAKMGVEHNLADRLMWGDDYPHAEGTWPDTRESIRFAFSDISPDATRKYLGDVAVDVYGFDRAKMTEIAARIGPTVKEVATPYTVPEGALVGTFAFRTGPGSFI